MTSFKPAGIHIVHQNIAGEVIVVDLEQGAYFSLLETAVTIWEGIAGGLSEAQILANMESLYSANQSELENCLRGFIRQLREEGLVVESAVAGEAPVTSAKKAPAAKVPLKTPELNKYEDMADVLALDPIHDFDEAGWPAQQAQPVTAQTFQ